MALLAKQPTDDGRPQPTECASVKQIKEWLEVLCRGRAFEVRSVGVERVGAEARHTESACYKVDDLGLGVAAKDARRISHRAEGVYFTLNPLGEVLDRPAKDSDVARRTWILIDVDPVRPSGDSSTDGEKIASWQVALDIRKHLDGLGWPEPILADSGNGWHLLYHVDLPADDGGLVKRALEALARRFDTESAKVDKSVYNPSRICKLYGTVARKGEHTAERPHRTSWVMEYTWPMKPVSREQLEQLAGAGQAEERPKLSVVSPPAKARRKGLIARDLGDDVREAYCRQALDAELAELSAAAPGGRNHQLFKSAVALFELAATGKIPASEVERELEATARSIGLKDDEIRKTINSARKKGTTPRDLSRVGKVRTGKTQTIESTDGLIEAIDDPHRLARIHLERHRSGDETSICWWHGEWWRWEACAWRPVSDQEMRGRLAATAREEFARVCLLTLEPAKPVGTRLIGNVALALQSTVQVDLAVVAEQPAWLDAGEVDRPDPAECLPTQSGILHLPTLLERGPEAEGAIVPPTSRFFTQTVLTYSFQPSPPEPSAWLGFLRSLWPEDDESIACLQEWFGYLLTPDTRQQKILMLIGPKRSGKGTITRTLEQLIGRRNIAAPTLSSLASQFGCQDLIGKAVAVCTESRLAGRADSQAIVERLLSISGEDPQTIQRKHVVDWTGYLKTRFVLLGNELPRLGDYSGALPGRLILLELTRSFFGKEDLGLQNKINAELPGILLWALAGWRSLRDRGRFVQPAAGRKRLEEFEQLTNPIGAFLEEKCDIAPGARAQAAQLYQAWVDWCKENGREHPGDRQSFGRNLRTVVTSLDTVQSGPRGSQVRYFVGVRLRGRSPDEPF